MSPLNCRITTKNYTKNRGNLTLTDMNTCEIKKVQYTSRIVNRRPVCFLYVCIHFMSSAFFFQTRMLATNRAVTVARARLSPEGSPGAALHRSVLQHVLVIE